MIKRIFYFLSTIAVIWLVYQLVVLFDLYPFYRVGAVVDSLNGVAVHYNGSVDNVIGRNLTKDGYNLGLKYQCVEFVKRYYYLHYSHKMPNSYGHAKDFFNPSVADGRFNKHRGLQQYRNPSKYQPKSGSILIFDKTPTNPYGHVAIVSKVDIVNNRIEIIQQNAGPPSTTRASYKLKRWQDKWYVDNRYIKGWLSPPDH